MKWHEGQLAPIKRRLNKHQQEKRVNKINARRTVADYLIHQNVQVVGVIRNLLDRGFWGRVKWVILGR